MYRNHAEKYHHCTSAGRLGNASLAPRRCPREFYPTLWNIFVGSLTTELNSAGVYNQGKSTILVISDSRLTCKKQVQIAPAAVLEIIVGLMPLDLEVQWTAHNTGIHRIFYIVRCPAGNICCSEQDITELNTKFIGTKFQVSFEQGSFQ
ncbi:hypothetical protein JTB14_022807 [Gonioctena quinquepunctata]|nr:hypothetical protein JTB14_022807 [Gonioctena quinquepunctata]